MFMTMHGTNRFLYAEAASHFNHLLQITLKQFRLHREIQT